MIMRLIKTAALVWLANKIKDKALGRRPSPRAGSPRGR